ncbi:hypothetical protein GRZ55_20990 [Chelativorans sp. ZYF759]|uniref:hypothetical protein n=1 Tax=Chelativorans sp. ZYF759 TaxID=2692213 RepID=UPI00145F5F41|nr:hypothetical protein [Chelativorans sp. ZYF759]NMG41716.1 hypothetical protein [Chelativorans sp. ZYF759]
MRFRLSIVILLVIAFGYGFAELVERSDARPGTERGADPCEDWSNPHCQGQPGNF